VAINGFLEDELIEILESTNDEYTRWKVAESLDKIGTGNERAIAALVKLLETTNDVSTCLS